MRVNRQLLYWGMFLAALGGVLVVTDLGSTEAASIADALRLWPLAVVAIGVGLVLRRTRFSLSGGLLAAAVPGLLVGGAFAIVPRIALDCGAPGTPSAVTKQDGVFDGPARISVASGCGSIVVSTAPGSAWTFDANDLAERPPTIDASPRSLSIDAGRPEVSRFFHGGRDAWHLTLPTSPMDDLTIMVNAGHGQIDLPGAQIGRLDLTTNAAKATVDLSQATVQGVSGVVNAGMLSIRLPAGADTTGTLEVNAGALQICIPSGTGLRVHHTGSLGGFSVKGEHQGGTDWESPDYASATNRADLNIDVNLGDVEIDPIGGC